MVRDFARKELAPNFKDRVNLDGVPRDILRKVGDLGLLGLNLPEEYGGTKADWVSLGIVAEEGLIAPDVLVGGQGPVGVGLEGHKEMALVHLLPKLLGKSGPVDRVLLVLAPAGRLGPEAVHLAVHRLAGPIAGTVGTIDGVGAAAAIETGYRVKKGGDEEAVDADLIVFEGLQCSPKRPGQLVDSRSPLMRSSGNSDVVLWAGSPVLLMICLCYPILESLGALAVGTTLRGVA